MIQQGDTVFKVEYNLRKAKFVKLVIEEYTKGWLCEQDSNQAIAIFRNMVFSIAVELKWIEDNCVAQTNDWALALISGQEKLFEFLKNLVMSSNPELSEETAIATVQAIIDQATTVKNANISPFN